MQRERARGALLGRNGCRHQGERAGPGRNGDMRTTPQLSMHRAWEPVSPKATSTVLPDPGPWTLCTERNQGP